MRAKQAFDLIVTRGRGIDQVEIVSIASGEVVLFWDTLPSQTGRLSRALRADLAQLGAAEFITKWQQQSEPA